MTSRVLSSYGVAIVSILLSYGTGSLAAEKSSTSVLLINAHPHPDGVSCCGCERKLKYVSVSSFPIKVIPKLVMASKHATPGPSLPKTVREAGSGGTLFERDVVFEAHDVLARNQIANANLNVQLHVGVGVKEPQRLCGYVAPRHICVFCTSTVRSDSEVHSV